MLSERFPEAFHISVVSDETSNSRIDSVVFHVKDIINNESRGPSLLLSRFKPRTCAEPLLVWTEGDLLVIKD